ncbi:hypothetical protein D3C77_352100 [compost metagenome]
MLFNLLAEQSINCLNPDELTAAARIVRSILKGALSRRGSSQGLAFQTMSFLRFMAFLESHLSPGLDLENEAAVSDAVSAIDDEVLLSAFPDDIVGGVDSIIPVVLHTTRPPFPGKIDWEWLKAGVKALHESGDHCPAVIFSQDGMVGSGRLLEPFRLVSPINDPDKEVYVIDESSALSTAFKMTWDEVKEFHAKRSQGYSQPPSDSAGVKLRPALGQYDV